MIGKNKQICPKCGLIVDNDAKFCEECGEKLKKEEKAVQLKKPKTDKKTPKERDSRRKLGIVLIIIVLFVGIYFIVGAISNSLSSSNTSPDPDNIISENQPVNGVYNGNGISFKVPSGYYVINSHDIADLVCIQKDVQSDDPSNNYEGMSISELPGKGNSLNSLVQKYTYGEIISKKSLTINGVPAYAIQAQNDGNTYFDIFIVKNGTGYLLHFFGNIGEGINPVNDPDIQLITNSLKIN